MPQYHILLTDGNTDESAVVFTRPFKGKCHLALTYRDRSVFALAYDYWEAFSLVRLELEKDGLLTVCNGGSINVFPSGQCREMGQGLTGYRMELGTPAYPEDRVNIFDQGDDLQPATVEDQKQRLLAWIASNKK